MRKIYLFAFSAFITKLSIAQWNPSVNNGNNIHNTNSGNVGIGTIVPNQKLEVSGSNAGGEVAVRITNSSQVANNVTTLEFADGGAFPVRGRIYTKIRPGGNSDMFFGTANTGGNVITDRMVIQTDGNVGIGTTNPQARLHLSNGAIMASDSYFNNINVRLDGTSIPALKFSRWTGTASRQHNAFVGQFYNPNLGEYSLSIGTGASDNGDQDVTTPVLTASLAGKVGVGTITPSAKLHVEGDILSSSDIRIGAQHENTGYGKFLRFGDVGNTDPIWMERYNLAQDQTELRVGIGDGADVNDKFVIGTVNWYDGRWAPSFFVNASGQVGIGTTDPKGYRFAVNGDAIFTKVKVKQFGSWPDYVFSNTYKLPSLQEVEQFIRQYKHLPDVPPAKEVERDGLDVGENQAVLLKKIEELTLYVIEQNRRLEEQSKKIEQLEKAVKKKKRINGY